MYWTIKVRHFDGDGPSLSVIRVHGEDLREAASKVLDMYRRSTIISYQENGGIETLFDRSHLEPVTFPTNIKTLETLKALSKP